MRLPDRLQRFVPASYRRNQLQKSIEQFLAEQDKAGEDMAAIDFTGLNLGGDTVSPIVGTRAMTLVCDKFRSQIDALPEGERKKFMQDNGKLFFPEFDTLTEGRQQEVRTRLDEQYSSRL